MNRTILYLFVFCIFFACKTEKENDITIDDKVISKYPPIHKASSSIQIDGHMTEEAWNGATWYDINHTWLGEKPSPEDFSGRFKILWDENKIYLIAEITDDVLMDIHEDGLNHYWDDDCLELFIDEDNSNGIHQYNHNAFAYHISKDLKVADIGPDSLPAYFNHHLQSAKVTQGNKSIWEVAIDVHGSDYKFGDKPMKLSAGKELGFMVAYCDNDTSEEREHFMGSIEIEGEDKNRGWIDAGVFNDWVLAE